MSNQLWFNTLNEALEAENLVELWPLGVNINYGQTVQLANNGTYISVYRDERGMYERPIHYDSKAENYIRVTPFEGFTNG